MYSLRNKVQLIGNLGKTPDAKKTESGKKLVKFTVATNEIYTNQKGEKVKVLKKIHRYTLVKKVPTAVIHRKETWKKFGKALEKDNEKCTFLSDHAAGC